MTERRIGVDATSWVNNRGFGRFTRNAISRLVAIDRDTRYVLFIDQHSAPKADLPEGAERRVVNVHDAPANAAAANSSRSIFDVFRLTRAARGARLDAMLFPSLYTYFPVPGIPAIVGIHDVIADERPELTFDNARARLFWRAKEWLAVRTARQLFTVSDASRRAVARQLDIVPERLPVVPEAPDPVFGPRSADEVTSAVRAIGVPPAAGFLLYSGGISPHKNIEALLEAYAAFREQTRAAIPALVIVGDFEGETFLSAGRSVRARIDSLGLVDSVVTPGFVSDDRLACLYNGATAVVLPSLAEGFGLPAVEAAACGAALVLSDLPAHRESLGDAALYFDPRDVAAMTNQLRRIHEHGDLRVALGRRARQTVAPLTWDATAHKLRALLTNAAVGSS
jgi:glycosyltransferase involved in cell wall biosynthesis